MDKNNIVAVMRFSYLIENWIQCFMETLYSSQPPATGHQPSPPPAANFKLFDPFKNAILSSASRPSDSDKLTFKSDLSKHIFLHEKYFDCKQKNIFIFSWCGIRDHERINIPYLTFAWVFPLYQL